MNFEQIFKLFNISTGLGTDGTENADRGTDDTEDISCTNTNDIGIITLSLMDSVVILVI